MKIELKKLIRNVTKGILLASVLPVSLSFADAIQLKFQFQNLSSSHSIYVCNAGLFLFENSGTRYFDSITKQEITAAACSANPHNCVTINMQDQYLKNSLKAEYGLFSDKNAPTQAVILSAPYADPGQVAAGAGAGTPFRAVAPDGIAYNLKSLEFNFASPVQTARFFVDVCYRGPQIEFYELYGDKLPLKWQVSSAVSTTNLGGGRESYVANSGLTVQTELACDVQGEGQYIYARNNSGMYNSLEMDEIDGTSTWGFRTDSDIRIPLSGVFALPATGTQNLFANTTIEKGKNKARAPRFCKVRYYFEENQTLRSWVAAGTQFTLSTTVNSIAR